MFFYFFPSSIRLLLFIISVIFNTLCFQLSVFIVFNGLDFLIFRVQSIFFASLSLSSSPFQCTQENLYNRDFLCDFLCFVVFSLFSSIFFFPILLFSIVLYYYLFSLVWFALFPSEIGIHLTICEKCERENFFLFACVLVPVRGCVSSTIPVSTLKPTHSHDMF